jgi:hypothetical protein
VLGAGLSRCATSTLSLLAQLQVISTMHHTQELCLLLRPFTPSQQGFVVGAGLSGCATSVLSLLAQLQASRVVCRNQSPNL